MKDHICARLKRSYEKTMNKRITGRIVASCELNCKKNHVLATNITLDFLTTVCDEVNNYS